MRLLIITALMLGGCSDATDHAMWATRHMLRGCYAETTKVEIRGEGQTRHINLTCQVKEVK